MNSYLEFTDGKETDASPLHGRVQGTGSTAGEESRPDWSELDWQAYVRSNVGRAEFNPLLTPDQLAVDPSRWNAARPNRLTVHQQHRYRYDSWGNCVEKRFGAHERRMLRWNAEHQLERTAVTRVDRGALVHEVWAYDYDPFGRRVAKYRLRDDVAANTDTLTDTATQSNATTLRSIDHTHRKHLVAQRVRARQRSDATHFAWDGNRLLLERSNGGQVLYLYEPESFVPLALGRGKLDAPKRDDGPSLPAELLSLKDRYPEQWAAIERRRRKLLRKLDLDEPAPLKPLAAEIFHVHADHLGTPRELTDADGHVVWAATYKAWGAVVEIAHPPRRVLGGAGSAVEERWEEQADPVTQNLRFQGQYFDPETGLHYNRYRYYDPDCGRFISQDPVGLAGGMNAYLYAPNPTQWIDPSGLCSSTLDRNLGGRVGDGKQAHHLIPEEIWGKHKAFFDSIGMGDDRDKKANGLLMPASKEKAKKMKRVFYHCGSHGKVFSPMVDSEVSKIEARFNSGAINAAEARVQVGALQQSLRTSLSVKGPIPIRLH